MTNPPPKKIILPYPYMLSTFAGVATFHDHAVQFVYGQPAEPVNDTPCAYCGVAGDYKNNRCRRCGAPETNDTKPARF